MNTIHETKPETFTTEILGHNVQWWVDSDEFTELSETDIEHIEGCIRDGYKQGQLCCSFEGASGYEETTGWWQIPNWQDIACELYHCVTNDTEPGRKARKRFDENWG